MKIFEGKDAWKNFNLEDNEMEFRMLNLGKVVSNKDKTYNFMETGRKLEMKRHDLFGIEFVLCSNRIYEVEIGIEVHFPDGSDKVTTMKIKNNVPQIICQGFLKESDMVDGKWSLRIHVPDNITDEHGESISVFGDLQEDFKLKFIRPKAKLATDEDISKIESMYNTTLNEDYKSFLKTYNGYNFSWWDTYELEAIEKSIGANAMDDMTEHIPNEREGEESEEVTGIFGVNTNKHSDIISENGEPYDHFYDVKFGRFFYPIGEDYGGNPMVQIAAGNQKGQIGMIDHEVWHGGMMLLLDLNEENKAELEVSFDSRETVDADTLIDYCEEAGFLGVFDETFEEYFERRKELCDLKIAYVLEKLGGPVDENGFSLSGDPKYGLDEVEIKKVGSLIKAGDSYKISKKGKKVKLKSGESIGIQFKIETKKEEKQLAKCSITTPSGQTIESEMNVLPNLLTTLAFDFDGAEAEKGVYLFKVKFPDNEMLETLKQKLKIVSYEL